MCSMYYGEDEVEASTVNCSKEISCTQSYHVVSYYCMYYYTHSSEQYMDELDEQSTWIHTGSVIHCMSVCSTVQYVVHTASLSVHTV